MKMRLAPVPLIFAAALMAWVIGAPRPAAAAEKDTYSQQEILDKAFGFFGYTTKGLAEAIQHVFSDQGRPVGFITGEEVSGAFIIGLRYGKGELIRKNAKPLPVFWQGPSAGFDFGGNASKVLVLIYRLKHTADLFRRFPGIDGSIYVVAGLGVNYQQRDDIVLAPIRTGVGLRTGASIGYLHYTSQHSWLPL